MIISKTPFRVSLVGGGTDYREYFEQYPSITIGFTIDKYSYIIAKKLPKFHNYLSKISYSEVELVKNNKDIKHNIVNKALEVLRIETGIDITHISDIPAGGVASSAAFTIGLINALQTLENKFTKKDILAKTAILLERDCLKETTGEQDAYLCSYGGFNCVSFTKDKVSVQKVICNKNFTKELADSCLLIHTGIHKPVENLANKCFGNKLNIAALSEIRDMSFKMLDELQFENIQKIGKIISDSWEIKKKLSPNVTNKNTDDICQKIKNMGGHCKLIGSGGRGFVLAVFDKSIRQKMIEEFKELIVVPFEIDFTGSQIIYSE